MPKADDDERKFWLRTLKRKQLLDNPITNKVVKQLIREHLVEVSEEKVFNFDGERHKCVYVQLNKHGLKVAGFD
jgi:hypothetical protein